MGVQGRKNRESSSVGASIRNGKEVEGSQTPNHEDELLACSQPWMWMNGSSQETYKALITPPSTIDDISVFATRSSENAIENALPPSPVSAKKRSMIAKEESDTDDTSIIIPGYPIKRALFYTCKKSTVNATSIDLPPLSPANMSRTIKSKNQENRKNIRVKVQSNRSSNRIKSTNQLLSMPKALISGSIYEPRERFTLILRFFIHKKISKLGESSDTRSILSISESRIFLPLKGFLTRNVSCKIRMDLVNMIQSIHKNYGYGHPETTWLAVNYIDRYISAQLPCRSYIQRQVLAFTAAMLAGKVMEETKEPVIEDMIQSSELSNISKQSVVRMEYRLLAALGWHLLPPNTPYTAFQTLMQWLGVPISVQKQLFAFLYKIHGSLFYHEDIVIYDSCVIITAILLHHLESDSLNTEELEKNDISTLVSWMGMRPGCPYRQCQNTIRSLSDINATC
jgi:hypothetical protein